MPCSPSVIMQKECKIRIMNGIVRVAASGILNSDTVADIVEQAVVVARKNNSQKFLYDFTKMKIQETTVGIYNTPSRVSEVGVKSSDRIAILYNPAAADAADFQFFETVAQNKGFTVSLFEDEAEAKESLSGT